MGCRVEGPRRWDVSGSYRPPTQAELYEDPEVPEDAFAGVDETSSTEEPAEPPSHAWSYAAFAAAAGLVVAGVVGLIYASWIAGLSPFLLAAGLVIWGISRLE